MPATKNILKSISTKQLLEIWETMSKDEKSSVESSMVRGWIMDEIEERFPEQFEAWMDGPAYDSELKNYILPVENV